MVEAVLSDIDGTLVESNRLHAAAWRDAFAVIDIETLHSARIERRYNLGTKELRI
jgi:beta-phosphoglucomutase-like phosphatase (HAD superfamily)